MANKTKDWQLYEAGKKYNNQLKPNYYSTVDANLAFFQGDQWRNLENSDMPKPVFNVIKRVIQFFIASLTSSKSRLHFEPLLNTDDGNQTDLTPSDFANAEVENLLEKFKMDFKTKEALFDAAITGDSAAHFYFDMDKQPYGLQYKDIKGEICMELVDGVNVMFGNANNPKVDKQPYVIIIGRDMVKNLQEEAKKYRNSKDDVGSIQLDASYNYQVGDNAKIEVQADEYGKALYIIVYRKDKKTGTIKATKSVETAYIYQDIDTGLTHYPVAWLNWEKQKNSYHGRALCTGLLPNQIFINRMFAMVMYHLMMTAFPKSVYNADMIDVWDNEIGSSIGISGIGAEYPIKNIAGYLEPGNMSNQIVQVIDMALNYTKEMLGISDAAMGQIDNPKNTSAIIAVQKSAVIPLENPKSNLYEWIEDIGHILIDMIGTYYGKRPIVMEVTTTDQQGQQTTQKQVQMYDFSQFKDLWLKVRADVGEASYWSEISAMQTLDNLLAQGHIDFVQYLERIPDEYIAQKEQLITEIKQNMANQQQTNQDKISVSVAFKDLPLAGQMQLAGQMGIELTAEDVLNHVAQQQPTQPIQQGPQQPQEPQQHPFDKLLVQLPTHEQAQFKKMDPQQQKAIVDQMIQQSSPQPPIS
jgi:hypothetical protein